jgi:hypothetical protein
MSQMNLWDRVAECTREIEASSDPTRREMFTHLRALWINLANESQLLSNDALAEQIAAVDKIHADLTAPLTLTDKVISAPPLLRH